MKANLKHLHLRRRNLLEGNAVVHFLKVIKAICLLLALLFPVKAFNQSPVKVFTVNTLGDASDPNAGEIGDDGHCDTDPLTPGDQCTFRAAIQNHNGNRNLGQNEIDFSIPNAPGTGSILIAVGNSGLGPLPPVLGSVIINGKNQADGRRIELDGTAAGANAKGLQLLGGPCLVTSFIINNFSSHGIFISGTPPPGDGGNVIKGNYIGTDATGKTSKGNGGSGVYIDNTGNDTIGGTSFDDLNIISGNKEYGIVIHGSNPETDFMTNGAKNNMVKGNFIGLDVDGNLVLPNEKGGILDENAPNNRIGDSTDVKAGNKLAGTKNGITVMGSLSEGVGIEGNFFQNGSGAKFSAGIFGRGGKGLYITGNLLEDIDSTAIDLFLDANGSYNIRKNRFQGSIQTGTKLRFGPGRTAEIDYVNNFNVGAGLAIDAEESLNSKIDWVLFGDTMRTGQAGANMIFRGSGKKDFSNNRWEGMASFGLNYVADLPSGLQASISETNELYANNGTEGVHGRIQGDGELALNIFNTSSSGNGTDGSRLDVFVGSSAKIDITARGNEYILSGRAGLRLTGDGQKLDLVNFVFERNLLEHNNFFGLELFNSAILRKSISNDTITNNGGPGIQLDGNSEAHIDSNIISGNTLGILINDASTATINNNIITGNDKGIALAGTGTDIQVTENSIFGNASLGIDLGNDGVSANDPGDADTGPNNFQNFPLLTNVTSASNTTNIQVTLNSTPNTSFVVEFFSGTACSPSGFGEGQNFLGSQQVTTDGNGNAQFSVALQGISVAPGSVVTATATDPQNNTSEFSPCLSMGGVVFADLELTKHVDTANATIGDTVTYAITLINKGPAQATGVVVTDNLPPGISFVGSTTPDGSYDNTTGKWTVGVLNSGSDATLSIKGKTTATGTITNTAEVTASDQPDPDSTPGNGVPTEDDQSGVSVVVIQSVFADLELAKTTNIANATIGDTVQYTLVLTNKGPDQATGLIVTDNLPSGISFVESTTSDGSYDNTNGKWSVGVLNSGSQATLTIKGKTVVTGTITNTAEVTASDQPDPDSTPGNGVPTEDDQSGVSIQVSNVTTVPALFIQLINQVNNLVQQHKLNQAQGRLLSELLNMSLEFYSNGLKEASVFSLRMFIKSVRTLMPHGQLPKIDGKELIRQAEDIIKLVQSEIHPHGREEKLFTLSNNNALASEEYRLYQNYPNPFYATTTISFELAKSHKIQVSVFNTNGKLVTRLLDKMMAPGKHVVAWQPENLSAGVYILQLRVGRFVATEQMEIIK